MGSMSIWHWLVVAVIVLLLFGRGKIPELMGDVAKGIKSFKAGMKDEDAAKAEEEAKKALEAKVEPSPKAGEPVTTAQKASEQKSG